MKKIAFVLILAFPAASVSAQEISRDLKSFNRIVASPRVNVILQKGDREEIRLVYDGVKEEKINIKARRKTLRIFLDNARKVEKPVRHGRGYIYEPMYRGTTITAYVTYRDLRGLEIRGDQELTCNDALESERFKLKAYGENDINLASLKTGYFKAAMFGKNDLKIKNGRVVEQKYSLYGENKIDTRELKSEFTSTNIFGEGRLRINTSEELSVTAFGEPEIEVDGGASVNRRLVLGKASILQR